ncbi:MAG: hypothetical protein HRT45_01385 [Bdellovibrionales bacterium]|nr:hypothetical protein [Bdellovibrionales bacterium]
MTKENKNELTYSLLYLVCIVVLGYMYLSPGAQYLMNSDHTKVLSDGTDPTSLPFHFSIIDNVASEHPGHLMYGAVPNRQYNAPYGNALWIGWMRKILSVVYSPFVIAEQRSVAIGWTLLVLNAMGMFFLGRAMKWPRWLAAAAGIAWAFNAFTRARAKVHMGLAGLYHLPLIFLGLVILQRSDKKKSVALAAVLFLIASMTAHYHVVLAVFLSPFFIGFYYLPESVRQNWKPATLRLLVAVLPAVMLLGWSFARPAPSDFVKGGANVMPVTGETKKGEIHPFLSQFAAHPIDYIAGDTGLGEGDWNPIRGAITSSLFKNMKNSNPHERANSIRWVILFLFFAAVWWLIDAIKRRDLIDEGLAPTMIFFVVFAVFCFWVSLGSDYGLATLIYSVLSQFRVSSRAGVGVHFATIIVACMFLNFWLQQYKLQPRKGKKGKQKAKLGKAPKWLKAVPIAFPLVMIADFPPFMNQMPIAAIQPAVAGAPPSRIDNCGQGLPIPLATGFSQLLRYYQLAQKLRRTDCQIMVGSRMQPLTQNLMRAFAFHPEVVKRIQTDNEAYRAFTVNFLKCAQANWVYFDPQVPVQWQNKLCSQLGWEMESQNFCKGKLGAPKSYKDPMLCLQGG